jgi:hypothetical protein
VFDRLFAPKWVIVQLNGDDFTGDAFNPQNGNAGLIRVGAHLQCVPPATLQAPLRRGPLRALLHEARDSFSLPDALISKIRLRISKDVDTLPLFSAGRDAKGDSRSQAQGAHNPLLVEEELLMLQAAWGARLTILYLPAFDPSALQTPDPVELEVKVAADKAGIRFHSLREEFSALALHREVPYGFSNTRLNSGHWNAAGHSAAARILEREIVALRTNGFL